ncbi:fumarylacetoacetate hydrolase family protein [Leifsonia sp. H3M29-4]|uniref:fumarylacetoacetate hydrolase family protein n=1 Tax=Salinibacterium metalliresistens TaxID=3031321 RepID=UPI0023DCD693|nr:fumarylacetoacetate hydrolase family protein [Salinibacterium metalliresistens]MDF1479421.1 fumarylacetoacetate hydrolase family protein [Salinibacterium metalliresistens]
MSFARLGEAGSEIPVLWRDGVAHDLRPLTADIDGAFLASDGIARARAADLPVLEGADSLRVGAPIARPGKIVCIGLNYRDHAAETGAAIPAEPVVFLKDPSTMIGPFDDVSIPRQSVKTDWEVELGVVIGRTARYLDAPDEADAVIAGYALSHDVSEREFQLERSGQWDLGKSCETFNPFGPLLVPADEVADPQNLGMRLWVNGLQRQHGTSADMIFDVRHVIWYLSQFMALRPGDVINTGTPAGVALGLPGNPYLRAGDVVELEIDGLGRAAQRLVQA